MVNLFQLRNYTFYSILDNKYVYFWGKISHYTSDSSRIINPLIGAIKGVLNET